MKSNMKEICGGILVPVAVWDEVQKLFDKPIIISREEQDWQKLLMFGTTPQKMVIKAF